MPLLLSFLFTAIHSFARGFDTFFYKTTLLSMNSERVYFFLHGGVAYEIWMILAGNMHSYIAGGQGMKCLFGQPKRPIQQKTIAHYAASKFLILLDSLPIKISMVKKFCQGVQQSTSAPKRRRGCHTSLCQKLQVGVGDKR